MFRRRRRLGVLSPTYMLKRTATRKGVLGGSSMWTVLFVFLYAPNLLRRLFGRQEVVVAREPLKSGQAMRLTGLGDLTKAERKAIRKAR